MNSKKRKIDEVICISDDDNDEEALLEKAIKMSYNNENKEKETTKFNGEKFYLNFSTNSQKKITINEIIDGVI